VPNSNLQAGGTGGRLATPAGGSRRAEIEGRLAGSSSVPRADPTVVSVPGEGYPRTADSKLCRQAEIEERRKSGVRGTRSWAPEDKPIKDHVPGGFTPDGSRPRGRGYDSPATVRDRTPGPGLRHPGPQKTKASSQGDTTLASG
jgi:hypothetical protein